MTCLLTQLKDPFFIPKTEDLYCKISLTTKNQFACRVYILENFNFKERMVYINGDYLLFSSSVSSIYIFQKTIPLNNLYLEHIYFNGKDGIRLTNTYQYIEIYGELKQLISFIKQKVIQFDFLEQFTIQSKIGKGQTAQVFKVKNEVTHEIQACKIFHKSRFQHDTSEKEGLLKELSIFRIVNHKNFIELYQVFETDSHIVFIMELLEGGELTDVAVNEDGLKQITRQLLNGIQYLHELGIFHRDIKFSNIMFKNAKNFDSLCIIDMGLADYYNVEGKYNFTRCGTPGFTAPEVLQDKPYTLEIDEYSVGIIMYYFTFGKMPYQSKDYHGLVLKNFQGLIEYDPENTSPAIPLIKQLLHIDPTQRIKAKDALNDSFLRSFRVRKTSNLAIPRANSRINSNRASRILSPQIQQQSLYSPQQSPVKIITSPLMTRRIVLRKRLAV